MSSSTILTSLALALVACTASPNVRIDVRRTDPTVDTTLTLCPLDAAANSSTCQQPAARNVFTTTALDQGVEIFVDDTETAITAYLATTATLTCLQLDITIGGEVDITYTGVVPATCNPAVACTTNVNVPAACNL